ncbi:hypothetical protein APHAL10511_002706 [Amanita phalloides]|nr:hypothetical protein APHAL10511_002706 [Amanita phalloides]
MPASRPVSESSIEKPKCDPDIEDKSKSGEPPVSILSLFRFSTKFELFIDFIGLAAAVAAGVAQPLMTLIFGNLTQAFVNFSLVINEAKNGAPGAAEQVPVAAAAFRRAASQGASYLVYIGIGSFVCTYAYMYIWTYTGELNARRIREKYLQSVLRQDITFFDQVGAGEVATRIQTDTHLIQQGISDKVALAVQFIAAFLCGFLLAFVRSWRLALALSSILPCIAITGGIMNKTMSKYLQLSLKYVADSGTLAEEVISTVRTAQAFGSQKILSGLYDKHIDDSRRVDVKISIGQSAGMAAMFFIIYSAYALAFNYGTTLINKGLADSGVVVNVIMSILIGSFSLALLAPELQAVNNACGAAAKIFATIDRVPTIDSSNSGGHRPDAVHGEISLDNVHFVYPSRLNVEVLKGFSVTFQAGKTAALVGASGSGKSTVISLVERFYDPTSGTVKLDGVDIKDLNLKWLRSQIGLVSQEPTLFATTIRGNVEHGLIGTQYEHAPEEEKLALVREACIKANADGFISKLPDSYNTVVGERGFLLSGGQKQRVAIARAIVSDPRILLLDEATSALDTRAEGVVQDALDKAAAGRTTITIAHRLSTVKNADIIYVMGEGQLLESGTHDKLLSANGAYALLVQAQKLREDCETSDDVEAVGTHNKDVEDFEKAARDEIPLGRKNTGHSLSSEIVEFKKQIAATENEPDYSLTYLFRRMGKFNSKAWPCYLLGSICAVVTGLVYPAFGIVFARCIQTFALTDPHQRRVQGDRNALWFFLIAIVSTLCMGLQIYLFSYAAARLTSKLRSMSFKAILRQDIEYFDRDENSTGALTANLSDNPQKVNGLAGITLGTIVQSIATLIIGTVLALALIWRLGLVGIACTPFLLCTGYIRLRVVVLKDKDNKRAHESSAQLACEAAGAIRTVASLTREDECCRLYSESLEEPARRAKRNALWSTGLFGLSQAMVFWVIALVFWYGAVLVSQFKSSTFHFFVALMSTVFGSVQVGGVFSFVPDISSARGSSSDIIKLLDSIPEIDAESTEGNMLNSEKMEGHIRLEGIHFRYPTRTGVRVLRGFSLEVQPGTYIALVGASGCGKSTIIQMLERFYDPLAGEIYLDGELITSLNVQEYRKQIALVSQEPTLYAGTIRFNILLGAVKPISEVSQEELEAVCRDANILDFIKSLPDGFETLVGGKGSQLSGGQKQRIAIARALLRNPKVLLLDEATSALDSASEKVVQDALDRASRGRTTIAIAHRLSTIQNANCIYFIKEGRVSEHGTHDQLLSKRGDYYEYVQLQALSRRT